MKIVQHEDEWDRACPELRRQPRRSAAQHRHAVTSHAGDQICAAQIGPEVGGRKRGEQGRGIIVEAVERHPGHGAILVDGPFRQEGRLAVARRRRDRDEAATARASGLNKFAAADGARARLRNRKLGVEQQLAKLRSWLSHFVKVRVHGRTFIRF